MELELQGPRASIHVVSQCPLVVCGRLARQFLGIQVWEPVVLLTLHQHGAPRTSPQGRRQGSGKFSCLSCWADDTLSEQNVRDPTACKATYKAVCKA